MVADASLPERFGSRHWADGPPPIPEFPGCYLASGNAIIFFDFLMLLFFELGKFLGLEDPAVWCKRFWNSYRYFDGLEKFDW